MEPAGRRLRILTSHGAVLLLLAHHPRSTVASLARGAGLTERQVARVMSDLRKAGYLDVEGHGTRRHYRVVPDRPLTRPAFRDIRVAALFPVAEALMAEAGLP